MSRALPLVRLPPHAAIHRFGTPTTAPRSSALLRFPEAGWTISSGGREGRREGWAIVGDAEGRRLAVDTLLSRHRIHPTVPPPGPFPYIAQLLASSPSSSSPSSDLAINPTTPIRQLAFARPPPSGEFTDFTARYGSLLEDDALTFRETLQALHPPPSPEEIERVAQTMRISHLLDLPSVSFSSGQTRRGRIAAALLTRPAMLILEEPMAGLDVPSREEVSRVLGELNDRGGMRVVLVLKGKGGVEGMPEWVTDVCEVRGGEVWIGGREEYAQRARDAAIEAASVDGSRVEEMGEEELSPWERGQGEGAPLVKLHDVSVSYGEGTRQVLKSISWSILPGSRWHLRGANGSGKTTLLSLILGHHPRSFSLPATSLELFGKPRRLTPTPVLRTLIGHTSPEIFASFPRGMGLTALESVGSGFEGVFSRRGLKPAQRERAMALLEEFADVLGSDARRWGGGGDVEMTLEQVAKRQFGHFTPPQQALLLFLRAIVARPPLLILDEPSQGMDEVVWGRCCQLLERERERNREQAVIVVSHYEDEVPWKKGRGKNFQLVDGRASIE